MTELPPLSLYLHFPWCEKKCPYCDFHSLPRKAPIPETQYITAILHHARKMQPFAQKRPIHSIFMGGGTPSLFSPASMQRLLDALSEIFTIHPHCEITLEANPGTFEAKKFSDFRTAGINRLSIGVQSFCDVQLKRLGRIHDQATAKTAIAMAERSGFDNFNIDIMFGLPQQSIIEGLNDLDTALEFNPPHLSWYQLTIEPRTPFYSRPPVLPAEDDIALLHEQGVQRLQAHGYKQYEVSAFSRNRVCRHNINYWEFGDYIGLGSGAHGKITYNKQVIRYENQINPQYYMALNKSFAQKMYTVPTSDLPFEYMLNTLRLIQGTELQDYTNRTFMPIQHIREKLQSLENKKLIHPVIERIQATPLGLRFLNDVLGYFMEETHAYH